MNIDFEELFAYRIQLLDFNDENMIILKLKQKLYYIGINMNEINDILYSFYILYDIPILYENIVNINIENEIENENENEDNINNNINNFLNIITIIIGINPPINNEDVLITTDENSLRELKINKIIDENENCPICLCHMEQDEEYFDLECKHFFHKNCLETYLTQYNHICPTCRKEIGQTHVHLN